jgi:hypothetical protein
MEWNAVMLLGAYHGINPGMGWLFAVALGMQQGSARGVWRALPPLALGHGLAVGAVLAVAATAQMVVPLSTLRILVAAILVAFGLVYLLVTASLACIVYSRVGLAVLRTAWFNFDWLWACVLVVTGVIVLIA